MNIYALSVLTGNDTDNNIITMDDVNHASKADATYCQLVTTIQNGFPKTWYDTVPALQ